MPDPAPFDPTRVGRKGGESKRKRSAPAALLFFFLSHLSPLSHRPRTGPDRKLYLPGGLLDPSEVPAYLNGTLPGE